MSQGRRKTPAIPLRGERFPESKRIYVPAPPGRQTSAVGELYGPAYYGTPGWFPPGGYGQFPFTAAVPPAAANPVIVYRYGAYPLTGPDKLVTGEYQRFPYLDPSLFPASPVIPPLTRRLAELDTVPLPEGAYPKYQRFPYLDATLFPTSPVIGMRYGQDILADPQALVPPAYERFPYFSVTPLPASPVIPIQIRLLAELDAVPLPVGAGPQYQRFPYLDATLFPASPVPGLRYGRLAPDTPDTLAISQYFKVPSFQEVVAPANPAISFRYGQVLLDGPTLVVVGQYLRFPYFPVTPAAANAVIAYRLRQLGELSIEPVVAFPQRLPFPYFEQPVPPPAESNPWHSFRRSGKR